MRILLYTGKGGVGKTSIAAATALKLSEEGKRVLIMSTDQAHSLRDSFERPLCGTATSVAPGLDAIEVDVVKENEDAWGHLQGYLKELLTAKADGGVEAEELLEFPGLEELFSLFKILDIYEADRYDVLIVDCAPTGETLSLLKFPELFGSFLDTVLPFKRKAIKSLGPLVQKLTKIPMPKDLVFDDIEFLFEKLDRLEALMQNKEVLSVRIVTTPEKIVIKEAKRSFTCLHLYNYNVDALIVNKVYPTEALEGYFHQWVTLQEEGLHEIMESFADIPIFKLSFLPHELKSLPLLREAGTLYGTKDPIAVFATPKIFELGNKDGALCLQIYLPFADKEEMELSQCGDELHIAVKNENRCFTIPDTLKGKEITSARMEQGVFTIRFE